MQEKRRLLIIKILEKDGEKESDPEYAESLKEAIEYYNQDRKAGYTSSPYTLEELEEYAENGSL